MKRILFVDDDVNVLHGLRRMLHARRREWQMAFAQSGAEALAMMERGPFDVIVTDMRMPGMNGAQLLAEVQRRHPATVRFVLSGQSNRELAMLSVPVSHQFLTKPCDAEQLHDVIQRCCSMQSLLRNEDLRQILGSVSELPPLPAVYQRLTSALSREDLGLAEVAEIVESDVAVTVKILQLVNSSYFGLCRAVRDIRTATSYMGVQTIRDLVLCVGTFRQFEGRKLPKRFSVEQEQEHAMSTARFARSLLDTKAEQEHAFLAGMLHGIGKLICATHLPEAMQRILDAGAGVTRPFHEVEREVLGVGHAEIGAYVLGLWGLPYTVIEAVAYHHDPSSIAGSTRFGVPGATHVACALTAEASGRPRASITLDEHFLAAAGVAERLDEWRQRARDEAEEGEEGAARRSGPVERRTERRT